MILKYYLNISMNNATIYTLMKIPECKSTLSQDLDSWIPCQHCVFSWKYPQNMNQRTKERKKEERSNVYLLKRWWARLPWSQYSYTRYCSPSWMQQPKRETKWGWRTLDSPSTSLMNESEVLLWNIFLMATSWPLGSIPLYTCPALPRPKLVLLSLPESSALSISSFANRYSPDQIDVSLKLHGFVFFFFLLACFARRTRRSRTITTDMAANKAFATEPANTSKNNLVTNLDSFSFASFN